MDLLVPDLAISAWVKGQRSQTEARVTVGASHFEVRAQKRFFVVVSVSNSFRVDDCRNHEKSSRERKQTRESVCVLTSIKEGLASDGAEERDRFRVAKAAAGAQGGEVVAASLADSPVHSGFLVLLQLLLSRRQDRPGRRLEVHQGVGPHSSHQRSSFLIGHLEHIS